jgi:hypothetical protein
MKTIKQTFTPIWFPNFPLWQTKLSDKILDTVKLEIEKIQSDFDNSVNYNRNLVGNLNHSYELITSKQRLKEIVVPLVKEYIHAYSYRMLNKQSIFELELDPAWVNFQKRHEFNPPHSHSGDFSFIIWIDIPYHIEEEYAVAPGSKSADFVPGHVCFQFLNTLGHITSFYIPADKTFNNTMLIFPSSFTHYVTPFYSTDSYRISVSGNIDIVQEVS